MRGSNLRALMQACGKKTYPAEIKLIICNRERSLGYARAARSFDIPAKLIPHSDRTNVAAASRNHTHDVAELHERLRAVRPFRRHRLQFGDRFIAPAERLEVGGGAEARRPGIGGLRRDPAQSGNDPQSYRGRPKLALMN